MSLLDAPEYDPSRDRRRIIKIAGVVVIVLIAASLVWWFRYWPEEHVVSRFFDSLQKQDCESAYGIWMHDPEWKKHPAQYDRYTYNDFYRDWGPGGEWGLVKSHEIYASGTPPGGRSSGVIVEVIVNGRTEHARVWVEKSDKTLGFSPY